MAIEDIFSDDIKKVNSCIGKFIKVSLMEQRQESGHIFVIDPVSETLVLVVQDAEKSKFVVVPRHVILDVQETSEPDRSDLLIVDKPKDLGNVEELKRRRDLLQAWFKTQMIFFEVEGLNLTLGPSVIIEPPYATENILVSTTVAMQNIQKIIDQMPPDFQA